MLFLTGTNSNGSRGSIEQSKLNMDSRKFEMAVVKFIYGNEMK